MDAAADLLAALSSPSSHPGLHSRFVSYLFSFSPYLPTTNPNPKLPAKKPTKHHKQQPPPLHTDAAALRPLAKRFLPFLCRALQLLPPLLRPNPSTGDAAVGGCPDELLDIYGLLLDCLAAISECLAGKPYSVLLQRGRFVCCLESSGHYARAEAEAVATLDALCSTLSPPPTTKSRWGAAAAVSHLPDPDLAGEAGADPDVTTLAVELTVCLANCISKGKVKEAGAYKRVLALVEQIQPWLQILTEEAGRKYLTLLVNALSRCAFSLAAECSFFDVDLVSGFCVMTLRECAKEPMLERLPAVARKICSSVDLGCGGSTRLLLDVLKTVVEYIVCGCKVDLPKTVNELLEFVTYFSRNFSANRDVCIGASKLLYEQGGYFFEVSAPFSSVLLLYATGLYFSTQNRESEDHPRISADILNNEKYLNILSNAVGMLAQFFCVANGRCIISLDSRGNCLGNLSLQPGHSNKKRGCSQSHGNISFLSYLDTLEFVCKVLLQHTSAAWNSFSEGKTFPCSGNMSYVLLALHQFIDSSFAAYSCTTGSEGNKERLHELRGTLLRAMVSALKISIISNEALQKSLSSINCAVSSRWIMLEELKFLISSLNNIGVTLYNIGHFEQAQVMLELCCQTVWANVRHYTCRLSATTEEHTNIEDPPKDTLKDIIEDTFARIAKIVHTLHKCGAKMICEIVVKSLSELLAPGNMSEYLNSSFVLIKQWVKIVCKDFEDDRSMDGAPLLYDSLMSHSSPLPKKMIGLILEQELLAYGLIQSRGTLFCKKMLSSIMDILLNEIYCSKEYRLGRSRVLVRKAHALRACGLQNISSSLESLSEAISLLREISLDSSQVNKCVCHQLAIAYCLHAHCAQEANLDCKVIFNNVRCALDLWSKVGTFDHRSPDIMFEQPSENLIPLLCSIVDLLAMKGRFEFQFDLCNLMIMMQKDSLLQEKFLSLLLTNGRLNHALCNTPIDQQFISIVSQHVGVDCYTTEFWRNCFKEHRPSLTMFLQMMFPTDLIFSQSCEHSFKRYFDFDFSIEEIQKAASSLISEVIMNDQSTYVAGCMYYDLSERLSSRGKLFQAFSYAKGALQLRKKLLRKKFKFNLGKFVSLENQTCDGQGFVSLEASGSSIAEIWPDSTRSGSMGDFFLTPWNALRCYLESILQVAMMHDLTGNGAEAEVLFRTGKEISYLQGLPTFGIAFTSLLGQFYRKRQLWGAAERELKSARDLLAENSTFISCKHCKLTLEISIDMQAGDLFWSLFEKDFQKKSTDNLSNALGMYQSAMEKLNCNVLEFPFRSYDKPKTGEWSINNHITETKHEVCNHGREPLAAKNGRSPSCNICVLLSQVSSDHHNGPVPSKSQRQKMRNAEDGPPLDVRIRKTSRNATRIAKELNAGSHAYTRTRSSKRKGEKSSIEVNHKSATSVNDELSTDALIRGKVSCAVDGIECSRDGICNMFGCWNCLFVNSLKSGCIQNILQFRWDCIRRRHLVALLLKIARALGAHGGKHGAHEVHNVYWQCISLLYFRSFPKGSHRTYEPQLIGLVLDGNTNDFLSLERAAILYNMCFFLLKGSLSEQSRSACCSFSRIEMSDAVPWLLKAFVLSRECPSLLQEVCRLLSCIFLLSTIDSSIHLPLYSKGSLSLNHWAAYFHQISVGTYLNCHYLSILQELPRTKDSKLITETDEDILKFIRFSSEDIDQLEEHIMEFFHKLPNVPIVCISMLGGDFVNLLGETLLLPSFFPAWTLLSRFDETNKPITMLLPVDVILEEMHPEDSSIEELGRVSDKNWQCPWGYSILDYVVPTFKKLLEENFLSLSSVALTPTDAQANHVRWWSQRMKLNNDLDKILRTMEESWLGPWKCLLLGDQLANQHIEVALTKLITGLESEFKFKVNLTLVKAMLCGVKSVDELQECVSQLIFYKGYFGRGGCCGKDRFRAFAAACQIEAEVPESLVCLIENTLKESAVPIGRHPVIFVLDTNVQMLPWENLPVLRSQEIYRMPSVGSVFVALTRSNRYKDASVTAPHFPIVDPYNTFYILNPSGDLSSTQEEFDQLFRNYEWKGKAGDAPNSEELVLALRNHDLFLYFGHGSGTQYISRKEIERLDQCAAALLMGCSSGTLHCKGGYAPQGAPLSYLFAGSPAVIANLWDVSDKDIDRFSKALLNSWLQENLVASNNCSKCCQLTQEFKSMAIAVKKNARTRQKGMRGKKLQQSNEDIKCCTCGSRRIASCISEARRACRLPLMIGASPVCYGVPTIIKK